VLVATVHLRMFERDASHRMPKAVLGIDAPDAAGRLVTVAHLLYEPVGDQSSSALALTYVMAHLIAGVAMIPDASRPSTIVRAGRDEAERLRRGHSPFTSEEADRIRAAASLAVSAP